MARLPLRFLLPSLLAVLVPWQCLQGGLIRDDVVYTVLNPQVMEAAPQSLIWSTPFQPELDLGLYRPVTTLSLRADVVLSHALNLPFGLQSAPVPHITNVLLSLLAVLAMVIVAGSIGFGPSLAGICAALYAVHPARSEAVFWISGRAECLMTVFCLAGLVMATRGSRPKHLIIVAACAVLAFFSKEQGAVLLPLLFLLPQSYSRDRWRHVAATGVALAGAFTWRTIVLGGIGPKGAQQVLQDVGLLDRLLIGLSALGEYVRLVFFPHPLLNEYPESGGVGDVWAWLMLVALVAMLAWAIWERSPRMMWALALFVLPLVPVLNIFYRTGETFAERFLCLPLAGAVFCLAALIVPRIKIAGSIFMAAIVICTLFSARRARDYQSEASLMEALLRDAPQYGSSYRLHAGISRRQADIANSQEDFATAFTAIVKEQQDLEKAIAIDSEDLRAHLELSKLLLRNGGPGLVDAQQHAQEVARLEGPETSDGKTLLAQVHFAQSKAPSSTAARVQHLAAAEQALGRARVANPTDTQATLLLISILRSQKRDGEVKQLVAHSEKALLARREARWWDAGLRMESARIFEAVGETGQALSLFAEASELALGASRKAEIAAARARILRGLGREKDAGTVLEQTLRALEERVGKSHPQGPLMSAMGHLEELRGKPKVARSWLQRALEHTQEEATKARLRFQLKRLNASLEPR